MRTIRVYIDIPITSRQPLQLPAVQSHHLGTVLRVRPGQTVHLFNGAGGCYRAEISAVHKHTVTVLPTEFQPDPPASGFRINLAQGISRGRHMDYTIQKAVELGVVSIIPLITEYGNVQIEAERREHKLNHWRQIIIGACEQCGRNVLPVLSAPVAFDEWIATAAPTPRCLLDATANRTLSAFASAPSELTLVAGPEGGFSERELALATAQRCLMFRLGPRILRTETAAVAAISACQTLWGDMVDR